MSDNEGFWPSHQAWDMSDTHTREDPKRKRLDCSIDSSDSSVLSEKRIREALSIDSSSSGGGDSLALEDSIAEVSFKTESPAAIQHQGEPLVPLTASTPISTTTVSTNLPSSSEPKSTMSSPTENHNGTEQLPNMSMSALQSMMERVLDKKLSQMKHEILSDLSPEFDKLHSEVFDLKQENDKLKKRVESLEKARQDEHDNIKSAKARAVENDQYARRSNIIVFGLEELRKDELIPRIHNIVKEKIKIKLNHDDIEICHRLGQKTLNKKRPVVVKFRYRDVKWDVMKERKNLKDSGITFSEDLCLELQQLQRDVSNHPGVQACWAWNGKVQAKDRDGNVKTVRYGTDWKKKFPVIIPPVADEPTDGTNETQVD